MNEIENNNSKPKTRVDHFAELAKSKIDQLAHEGREQAQMRANQIDRFGHEQPWILAGILAGVAAIFGFLVGRGSKK